MSKTMVEAGGVVVGLVGTASSGSGSSGSDSSNRNNGNGNGFRTKDPWKAALAIVKWYEENGQKLAAFQKLYKMKREQEEKIEELRNSNDTVKQMEALFITDVKISPELWETKRREFSAAENFKILIRKNPELARLVLEIVKEIQREHGFQSIIELIFREAEILGYIYFHTCKAVNRAKSRKWQFPCYRICEQYKIIKENGKRTLKKIIPVTILRHIDKETGRIINEEYRWGHKWIDCPPDSLVYTEIIRDYKEYPLNDKEIEIIKKLGFYCPVIEELSERLGRPMIAPEKEMFLPEPCRDHFPEDIIASTDDDGGFKRIWLSRKHGSSEGESEYEEFEEEFAEKETENEEVNEE